VGGILANRDFPADFIADNLAIELNVIRAAHEYSAKKLLFLGSSCIYPRECPQPIREEYLLSGLLEPTNEPYAIAKIAGIKLCQSYDRQYGTNFIACMPTNLYGPGDNFDLVSSHVLPAMIRKFHDAKLSGAPSVMLWGDGSPRREFLHVDDMAAGCLALMRGFEATRERSEQGEIFVNIGTGEDVTIRELAETVRDVVEYVGDIEWDASKPNGTPRKLLDVSRIREFGWSARISLREGIEDAYRWFLAR
jgi:GDP-L-fucose synthase